MNRNLTKSGGNKNLDLWSPWSVFKDDLWDLFDNFTQELTPSSFMSEKMFTPKIEVKDKGSSYELCAEVPGMDEKDINITLKDNHLIIEGEKKNEFKEEDKKQGRYHSEFSYGRFYRTIPLSEDVDADKVEANYKNGVLRVELQKLPEAQSKSRKIAIGGGAKKTITEAKH